MLRDKISHEVHLDQERGVETRSSRNLGFIMTSAIQKRASAVDGTTNENNESRLQSGSERDLMRQRQRISLQNLVY